MALVEKSSAENTVAEINQREESSNQNLAAENSAPEVKPREESSCQNSLSLKKKRTNNLGVRVKGVRIYDSVNGKTCHQCRQKMRGFAVFCKQLKKDKLCTLTYCHKCLLNRYGENTEEVGKFESWICPKCRGVCNCSFCMKRKGFQPTGILTHVAKSNGFNSVHELLDNKGAKKMEPQSTESTPSFYNKGSSSSKRSHDKENQSLENEAGPNEEGLAKRLKFGTSGVNKEHDNQSHGDADSNPLEDISLPQGSPLTEVAGTELPALDVGAALQFLEFCYAFSKVLDLRERQPECILRDLTRGCLERHGVYSAHVEFTIKLLSLIGMEMKNGDAWLQALKRCIEKSKCTLEGLPLDLLANGSNGYDNLEPSIKLKILNFLCDEVLYTEKLRSWIDQVAVKFDEGRKENRRKLLAAKKKEKLLKQQVKDEAAKAMLLAREGTPPSLPEFDGFLSQSPADADGVHAEVLAYVELIPKKNQRSDAVRTDYVVRGNNRQIFWKLNGYNNRSNIILQVVENWDSVTQEDKWFFYNEEEEKVVEKYISSVRNSATIRHRSDDVEGTKSDSHGSKDCVPQ